MPGPAVSFYDVASVSETDATVVAGSGYVFAYNADDWNPKKANPQGKAIRSVDRDGSIGLAAGTGGFVYDRVRSSGRRKPIQTPAGKTLHGAPLVAAFPDVAVGGSGRILERSARLESTKGNRGRHGRRETNGSRPIYILDTT